MTNKPPKVYQPIYAHVYEWLIHVAREHGYALALHGSLTNDLDLLAVAWTDGASTRAELVAAVAGFLVSPRVRGPEVKPHGRLAWTVSIPHVSGVVDLSVLGPDS